MAVLFCFFLFFQKTALPFLYLMSNLWCVFFFVDHRYWSFLVLSNSLSILISFDWIHNFHCLLVIFILLRIMVLHAFYFDFLSVIFKSNNFQWPFGNLTAFSDFNFNFNHFGNFMLLWFGIFFFQSFVNQIIFTCHVETGRAFQRRSTHNSPKYFLIFFFSTYYSFTYFFARHHSFFGLLLGNCRYFFATVLAGDASHRSYLHACTVLTA
jgi:hypothetical protein